MISLELERVLLRGEPTSGYSPVEPAIFYSILHQLASIGWAFVEGQPDKVVRPSRDLPPLRQWSCTCDLTTSLFETTVTPAPSVHEVVAQQRALDAAIAPALHERGLTLLQMETNPAIMPSRTLYARTAARWRQSYVVREARGEDLYWASWIAGSTPCIDVPVRDAIRAMRLMVRLTPVALLLSRSGAVTGGRRSPAGRLTMRPQVYRNLYRRSPNPLDSRRIAMPSPELSSWQAYFDFLLSLPPLVLVEPDGCALRVLGDTDLATMLGEPGAGWQGVGANGVARSIIPDLHHVSQLQSQIYLTRPRWRLSPQVTAQDLLDALAAGDEDLMTFLEKHLEYLYLEIRPDSPAPPGEDVALLALWCGLLENLNEAEELVMGRPAVFWRRLHDTAEFGPLGSRVDGVWIPDLIGDLAAASERGLARRGLAEARFLRPIAARLDRLRSPAEDVLDIVARAGGVPAALSEIHERYRWRP